ncbi:xaa-Arg dipeptidase-like isoform X2 [Rhipicephalus microplus]|uniref:xaa-Arg dipeptidase-like isoform X2 n=1 Tax=Rhipicephalus microplus TaxID=6941 RepID=UPI003F6B69AD
MAGADYSPAVCKAVDESASQLRQLSMDLWNNPELAFKEVKSHDLLTRFLEVRGLKVQRNYLLDTAFRAEAVAPGKNDGPTVCLMAEYDALPEIGHGCGHNLIAEASMGAAVGVTEAMKNFNTIGGKLVVLGTPAEESAGGKVLLLEKGAFKDIDVALMAHPGLQDGLKMHVNARRQLNVRYEGKAAHGSDSPWEGLNAQDAAVAAYINMSMLRQHTKPADRILGVVKQFGERANVTSESSKLVYHVRAPKDTEKDALVARAEKCFQAAARATGCGIDIDKGMEYKELIHNEALIETYRKYGEALGVSFADALPGVTIRTGGSTDAGNVSYVLPTLHASFGIGGGGSAVHHTRAFAKAAATDDAHQAALRVAKILALTALDLMSDPELVARARSDFETWKVARGAPSK